MKNNFYRRGLLAISIFFLGACVLFGQKNSDKQDDPILLYPLGTTWYYHTSEKTSMDSPSYFGYIRHRVEKNIQIGEYQAQEIQVVHKDWTGLETPMEPFYLYRKGDKAYAVESDGLRLLYDLAAEVGDVVPLPVNQGTAVEGFSHGRTTVIEKSTINVDGRDLVRQVYRLNYYFAEGPWPEQGKLVEVIQDLGILELNAQYEKPLPYGIIVDYINPKPLLRCFFSDDFEYKAPFWEERPCDAYGVQNSLTALSGESTPFSVNPEYIRFGKEHSGLMYQILNANGLQMLRGNLKGGETEINISALQRGLYIIQWQESHTGLRHSAVFYNTL